MKTMLEKLTKESQKKEVYIKLQEEKIAKLTRKLEKQLAFFESEEEEHVSIHSKASNEEVQSKKIHNLKDD